MVIAIFGCGWFGQHFAKSLVHDGHRVKGSTTTPAKLGQLQADGIEPYLINFTSGTDAAFDGAFFKCDVLVVSIPPKVRSTGGGEYLNIIAKLIVQIKEHAIRNVIFISSTSVLGDVNSEVDEDTPAPPESLSGQILLQSESLFRREESFVTTVVRFAGLIGPGRDPGRFFAGKTDVPNGRAPVNLIHQEDCTGICKAILQTRSFGLTLHACAPDHPMKMTFYTQASVKSGLEVPVFLDELKEWKVVTSTFVEQTLAYTFIVPNWLTWLER